MSPHSSAAPRLTRLLTGAAAALLLLAAAVLVGTAGATESHRIAALPGLKQWPSGFEHYVGYVTVNNTMMQPTRNLFFWLQMFEGTHDAKTPLLLWLQGGPGCSGLMGATSENGAFAVLDEGKTLTVREHRWSRFAHVIYIEAPVGVGFSYATDGNYTTGDDDTARDNLDFLLGFFDLFPALRANPLFISGESYAGHYVPQLAARVAEYNAGAGAAAPLRLSGFSVGNPSFVFEIEANAKWPFMAMHGLLSHAEYEHALAVCNGSFYGAALSVECRDLLDALQRLWIGINPYNVLAPCVGNGPGTQPGCFTLDAADALSAHAPPVALAGAARSHQRERAAPLGQTFVPCVETATYESYFARADVRAALFVPSAVPVWSVCSPRVQYRQYAPTVVPEYDALSPSIPILVYSGDIDSCVPYLGTEECVSSLGYDIADNFRPWFYRDANDVQQIAGYVTTYATGGGGLMYVTVKGAGHMVPQDKPQQAFEMERRFLYGEPL